MSTTVHAMVRTYTIPQLRGLVRNAQQMITEISVAMEDMDIVELTPAWLVKCEQAEAQLKHYQRLLAAYELAATSNTIPPAAPANKEITDAASSQPGAGRPASAVAGLAGSLVTTEAAQPGSSS